MSGLWERPVVAPGLDIDRAALLGRRLDAATAAGRNPATQPGSAFGDGRLHASLSDAVITARRTGTQVSSLIGVVALAGAGLMVVVAGIAAEVWADRRRTELVTLAIRGAGPGLLATRALLEMGGPIVAGGLVGVAAAWGGVHTFGPSALVATGAIGVGAVEVTALCVAAALAVAGCVGWRVRRMGADPGAFVPSTERGVPWEVGALVLAVAAWWELHTRAGVVADRGTGRVDQFVLLVPLLLIVGVAGIVGRLGLAAVASGRGRRFRPIGARRFLVPVWLAARRMAAFRSQAVGVFTIAALTVGASVFGATLASSLRATLAGKTTIGNGAAQVITLAGPAALPTTGWAAHATEVTDTAEDSILDRGHRRATVIGVDPGTFARGAFWDPSFAGPSLSSLLKRLGSPGTSGVVPILATADLPDHLQLSLPATRGTVVVDAAVVGRVRAFPGEVAGRPVAVVARSALSRVGVDEVPQVWLSRPTAAAEDDLARGGARVFSSIVNADAASSSNLSALASATEYLKTCGLFLMLIAIGAAALYLSAGGVRRATSESLIRRLGFSGFRAWDAAMVEIGGLILGGAAVGALVATVVARLMLPSLDPSPTSPPPFILRANPAWTAATLAAVAVAAGAVAAVTVRRGGSR